MDIEQMKKDLGGGNVFPIGEENVAFAKYFTGECYLNMLTTERVPVGLVTFAPKTINAYHVHHKGGQRAGQYSTLQKSFGTRKKQKNNLVETARQDRFAQSTDVYAVKASNYKGLRRGSPVYCRNNWHIHHAKSGGGQILVCVA